MSKLAQTLADSNLTFKNDPERIEAQRNHIIVTGRTAHRVINSKWVEKSIFLLLLVSGVQNNT